MESIPEEGDAQQSSPESSPRCVENKQFKGKTLSNTKIKDTVNSEFVNCNFSNILFQHLSGCRFTSCEFTGCVFQKDVKNCQFIQCRHQKSNLTSVRIRDCIFDKTALVELTAMFTVFDNCQFMDGEYSSQKTQNCKFLNVQFERFNILSSTSIVKGVFTGSTFDTLTIRDTSFVDSSFKNCRFKTVNQSQSQCVRCSFPYCSLFKCTYSDNKFIRCLYDHFNVKHSNILRNNFEGSSMDHTTFERTNFSYNNLSKGSFYNINFTFCTTRDNNKKDAVFCNSEMLTSTKMEVCAYFKDQFDSQDSYTYNLKLVFPNGETFLIPDQDMTVKGGAPSVSFVVSYELLNACSLMQVVKTSSSAFSSIFNYSQNEEEVFKHILIDDRMFLIGKKIINGTNFVGFIPPQVIKKKRCNSL